MTIVSEVLLVDDNPGDTELTADLLNRNHRHIHVHCVVDGVEAMAFLRREGKYSGALCPHLVLLDLNMPRKNGWAVLVDVKSDDELKRIPIVIFTTSDDRKDIARSYKLGANSYITKPGNLDEYTIAVASIRQYWFGIASLLPSEGQ